MNRQMMTRNDQQVKINRINKQCLDNLTKNNKYDTVQNFFQTLKHEQTVDDNTDSKSNINQSVNKMITRNKI